MTKAKKSAIWEALVDTSIGTLISVPLNLMLAVLAIEMEWSAVEITFYFTSFFFVLAVWRKVVIRLYFARKQENDSETED